MEKGKTVKFSNLPVTGIKENWTAGGCKQIGPCVRQVLPPEVPALLLASCGWFMPSFLPDRTGTSLVPSQRLTGWPAEVGLGLLQCSHWMEQRSDVNHVAHSSGLASLEDLGCQRGSRSSSARFSGRYFQQNTSLFDGDTLSPVQHNPPARLKAQEHPRHR